MSKGSVKPTKRALALAGGAIALFVVGTNVQSGWVLVIAALLIGVLAVGVLMPLRGSAGLTVTRRVPRTATAGQMIPVSISVTNSGSRTRGLVSIVDEFCGRGAAVVGILRPGEVREYAGRRDGARRGVYASGQCAVVAGSPFGVLRVKRTTVVGSPVVVYPRTYDAPEQQLLGLGTWRAAAPIGDASAVRDYHRGDPLRHVHWRSSARRGELMVREFDAEKRAEVTIVTEVPPDRDDADAIASIACSLGLAFLRGGDVRLVAGADEGVHATRVRDRESLLEWGARLGSSGTPLAFLLDAAMPAAAIACVCSAPTALVGRLRRAAEESSLLVVLVAERPHDAYAATVATQLRSAGARVAVVVSSEVETWFADGCVAL